jgi:hypothetical protein
MVGILWNGDPAVSSLSFKGEHALADYEFKQDEKLPKWHGWYAARRGLGNESVS